MVNAAEQHVDPTVSRTKFDREITEYLSLEADYRARGWFLVKADWPVAVVVLASNKTSPPAIVTAVQFDYTNYDAEPPSVRMIDPFSGRFLLSKELPTRLHRAIPGPEMPMPDGTKVQQVSVQELMQAPLSGRPTLPLRSRRQGIPRPPWPFRRSVGNTPDRRRRSAGSPVGGDFQVRPRTRDRLPRQPRATCHLCCLGASSVTLRGVRRFRIQVSAIRETMEAIRSAGQDGYELFIVWSGARDEDIFTVAEVHIPEQISYKLDAGLCVRVDGPELHRLNMWLYEAQQVIGVQVHGHPSECLSLGNR